MKKKILVLVLCLAIVASLFVALASCKDKDTDNGGNDAANKVTVKIGVICLHDENSTYDKNFIDAVKSVKTELGLADNQLIIKTGIPEDNTCYETAADLVDQGCNIIFADSFGHEDSMIKAAKEFTDVEFCHATGTKAHTEKLANYHNAFAAIYEGRFLAGIAAGMKLNAMAGGTATGAAAKIGYVGAFTYAEVISGMTSFYLGAKSVCPAVTMDVKFTGSWYDYDSEFQTANDLIDGGCVLISQHADSMGAPNACKTKNIPNVTYNISTVESCPDSYLCGSKINWAPYFKYIMECVQDSKAIATDWTGTINDNSVQVLGVNTKIAAEGTQAAIDAAIAKFKAGTLNVYDVSTFTMRSANENATVDANGHLTAYSADVDDAGDYVHETQVITDGCFQESKFRSAPYFDLTIDGITFLNTMFG